MVLKRRIRESARVGLGLAVPAVLVAGVVSMGGALPASAATSVDFSYTASGWTASHFPYCPDYTPLDVVAVADPNAATVSTGDTVSVHFDFSPAVVLHSSSVTQVLAAIRLTSPSYDTRGGYATTAQTLAFTGSNIQSATTTFAGTDNYVGGTYTPVIGYGVTGPSSLLVPDPTRDAVITSMSVVFTAPGGGTGNPDFSNTTFIARADIQTRSSCPDPGPAITAGCSAGQYDDGSGCVSAPPGYYVPTSGATSATPCPVGTYQPLSGSVSCNLADPGHYVSSMASLAETQCPLGKYQPAAGSVSCITADPGYYVDTTGATAQTPCPAGYTSSAGASSCHPVNTPPTANAGGPYLGPVNTAIAFDGSQSSDTEADPLTYSWDFGDGTTGTGVAPAHSYTAAGIYTVCLTVNDGQVNSTSPSCTMAVVYDPSAGFVTGGGWIDSPVNTGYQYMQAGGRATFGFVAKYQKGANAPVGNTAFQFTAGGLDFTSTSYDWLVVSGSTAQYKGHGTVNGQAGYSFLATAGDSSPDTFRIKIWDDNATVYDNGSQQALGSGSIVVHTK